MTTTTPIPLDLQKAAKEPLGFEGAERHWSLHLVCLLCPSFNVPHTPRRVDCRLSGQLEQRVTLTPTIERGAVGLFIGPTLGVKKALSLDQILARHPMIRSDRRIAAEAIR